MVAKAESSMIDGMLLFAFSRKVAAPDGQMYTSAKRFIARNDKNILINWGAEWKIVKYHKN